MIENRTCHHFSGRIADGSFQTIFCDGGRPYAPYAAANSESPCSAWQNGRCALVPGGTDGVLVSLQSIIRHLDKRVEALEYDAGWSTEKQREKAECYGKAAALWKGRALAARDGWRNAVLQPHGELSEEHEAVWDEMGTWE